MAPIKERRDSRASAYRCAFTPNLTLMGVQWVRLRPPRARARPEKFMLLSFQHSTVAHLRTPNTYVFESGIRALGPKFRLVLQHVSEVDQRLER